MNYRSRIRKIEKRLRNEDKSGSNSMHNNSKIIEKILNFKLSEVKDQLMNHYKINCTKNTFRSYESSFTNFIRLIGDKEINSINRADLEDFKIKRSSEVSQVSVNIDIRNLKAIFNKMVDYELIEYSKFSGVKQFKIQNEEILTIETVDLVKILFETKGDQMNHIIRFTLNTACRISEVLDLKIKGIDFKNNNINIYQKKTNSYKSFPISDSLTELLEEILPTGPRDDISLMKEGFLFYDKIKNDPGSKLRTDTISKKFKKIIRKLKLNSHYKFHSLRHTAITEFMNNNVQPYLVQKIAGHSSINTTMLYSHARSEDLKIAVNSVSY
jgi:integrase/recombinase XerD